MTQEEKIIEGLDKDLKQLIDIEMNDPVIGKLLNRHAAYVLGKEIKLVLIERACEWLRGRLPLTNLDEFINEFKKAMNDESK